MGGGGGGGEKGKGKGGVKMMVLRVNGRIMRKTGGKKKGERKGKRGGWMGKNNPILYISTQVYRMGGKGGGEGGEREKNRGSQLFLGQILT